MKRWIVVVSPAFAGLLALACSSDPDRPSVTSSSGDPGIPTASGGSTSSGGTGGSTSSSSSSSSSSSGSTTSSSGATSSGGASSGGPDASTNAACQGVPREGADIAETAIAAAPPVAGGGKIADGKYHLTLWESYTGPGGTAGTTGEVRRATLIVTGTRLQLAVFDVEAAMDKPIVAEEIQTSGSILTSDEICPLASRQQTRGYTASPTELELLETFGAITTRFVYTKQ